MGEADFVSEELHCWRFLGDIFVLTCTHSISNKYEISSACMAFLFNRCGSL